MEDIQVFYGGGTRAENDASNKKREGILKQMQKIPTEYFENEVYGEKWRSLRDEWNRILGVLKDKTSVPEYKRYEIQMKAGRKFNYDADLLFYNETQLVATRKIEFKYGAKGIGGIPQFLSLQARNTYFPKGYDEYYYDYFLDEYVKCDPEIKQKKPEKEKYMKYIPNIKYTIHPFFAELKERESNHTQEKHEIVKKSIKRYLEEYGHTFNIELFTAKVKESQSDKQYILWDSGKFYYDTMSETEMNSITFSRIVNDNCIELVSGPALYKVLVRWRNHKGILNPALQISLHRKQME
jgi:hypothetical protein